MQCKHRLSVSVMQLLVGLSIFQAVACVFIFELTAEKPTAFFPSSLGQPTTQLPSSETLRRPGACRGHIYLPLMHISQGRHVSASPAPGALSTPPLGSRAEGPGPAEWLGRGFPSARLVG